MIKPSRIVSSAKRCNWEKALIARLLMSNRKWTGPNTDPCHTPQWMGIHLAWPGTVHNNCLLPVGQEARSPGYGCSWRCCDGACPAEDDSPCQRPWQSPSPHQSVVPSPCHQLIQEFKQQSFEQVAPPLVPNSSFHLCKLQLIIFTRLVNSMAFSVQNYHLLVLMICIKTMITAATKLCSKES